MSVNSEYLIDDFSFYTYNQIFMKLFQNIMY